MVDLRFSVQHNLEGMAEEFGAKAFELGENFEKAAKELIDASIPRGRLYKRKAITGKYSKKLENLGLKRRGKSRLIPGYRIHRASAEGQVPAKDSGKLYRSIKAVKRGKYAASVKMMNYAGILDPLLADDGKSLNRPFAGQALELAVQRTFGDSARVMYV